MPISFFALWLGKEDEVSLLSQTLQERLERRFLKRTTLNSSTSSPGNGLFGIEFPIIADVSAEFEIPYSPSPSPERLPLPHPVPIPLTHTPVPLPRTTLHQGSKRTWWRSRWVRGQWGYGGSSIYGGGTGERDLEHPCLGIRRNGRSEEELRSPGLALCRNGIRAPSF